MILRLLIIILINNIAVINSYGQIIDTVKTNCPFAILIEGIYNKSVEPDDYIIETNSDLRDYWANAFGPSLLIPNIYFSSSIVIAINECFGTGGYRFQIKNIYEIKDKMIINIIIKVPKGPRTMAPECRCIVFKTKKTYKKIELNKIRI